MMTMTMMICCLSALSGVVDWLKVYSEMIYYLSSRTLNERNTHSLPHRDRFSLLLVRDFSDQRRSNILRSI